MLGRVVVAIERQGRSFLAAEFSYYRRANQMCNWPRIAADLSNPVARKSRPATKSSSAKRTYRNRRQHQRAVASPMTLVLDSGGRGVYRRGMKVTVMVHGMSEVNIDAQLIAGGSAALSRTEEKLIEMTNGCICCTLREVSSKSRLQ
jgi:hypothetical protein